VLCAACAFVFVVWVAANLRIFYSFTIFFHTFFFAPLLFLVFVSRRRALAVHRSLVVGVGRWDEVEGRCFMGCGCRLHERHAHHVFLTYEGIFLCVCGRTSARICCWVLNDIWCVAVNRHCTLV